MIDIEKMYEEKERLERVRAEYPGLYQAMIKEKKHEERILPRSLRRAFRSKNKKQIEQEIGKAMSEGFSKEDILKSFREWQKQIELIK